MLPIELHDSIIISKLQNSCDNFVTVDDFSNGLIHYNLASTGINVLAQKYGFTTKFRVYIHKVIPMQAGLGGGSSNAAFTMKAVCSMLKLNVTDEELMELAAPFGADIPFFIKCEPSRAKGIGEILEPIEIKNNYYCLIVKPSSGCSTKEVFAIADQQEYKPVDIDTVVKALKEGDDELLANSIGNSLEEAAISLVPEIAQIKETLKAAGLKIVLMSGSGSTVFALSTDQSLIKKVAKQLEDKYVVEVTKVLKK
jgi:4-diphosphocytidyl-2C-methyl-D-erythritol kinase